MNTDNVLGTDVFDEDADSIVKNGVAVPLFQEELARLRPRVEAAKEREDADARYTVESMPEVGILHRGGLALRDLFTQRDDHVKRIENDPDRSAQGKRTARDSADQALRVALAKVRSVQAEQCNALLRKFPSQSLASPSAEVASEQQVAIALFGVAAAVGHAGEVIQLLDRATDPAIPPGARLRCNQLLQVHAQLCQRRAVAPERHARTLVPVYSELMDLIGMHLNTVLQAERHRVALELTTNARQDLEFVIGMAEENGRWDDTYLIGAPTFA